MKSVQEMRASERVQLMRLLDQLMAGMAFVDDDGRLPMLFQEDGESKKRRG